MPKKGSKSHRSKKSGGDTPQIKRQCGISGCKESAIAFPSLPSVVAYYGFDDKKPMFLCIRHNADGDMALLAAAWEVKEREQKEASPSNKEKELVTEDETGEVVTTELAIIAAAGGRKRKRGSGLYLQNAVEGAPAAVSAGSSLVLSSLSTSRVDNGKWRELLDKTIPSRKLIVNSLADFSTGNLESFLANLSYLTLNEVRCKTNELGRILEKTPKLRGLSLSHIDWELAVDDAILPAIPTLKCLTLKKKDHLVLDKDVFKFVKQEILEPYANQLQCIVMDGQLHHHYLFDKKKELYSNLEELELSYFNPHAFERSPFVSAPIRKLVIDQVYFEKGQEKSLQMIWNFISNFTGTLNHLHLETANLWKEDNETWYFKRQVKFSKVKTLILTFPEKVDNYFFLRDQILPQFPVVEKLIFRKWFNKIKPTQVPRLKILMAEMIRVLRYSEVCVKLNEIKISSMKGASFGVDYSEWSTSYIPFCMLHRI